MTLDEWHAVLATNPATPYQRGAIMHEFERLGYGRADRAERLAISAAIVGLDTLGSTADLRMGEAGQLVRVLMDCDSRDDLLARSVLPEVKEPAIVTVVQLVAAVIAELHAWFPFTAADAR